MKKIEIVKEIEKCGIIFISETPAQYAKRHTKDDLLLALERAQEWQKRMKAE